jgi:hypothetical protein
MSVIVYIIVGLVTVSNMTFGIGAKYQLGDSVSIYSVLFCKVYSAVFVYICNMSDTDLHLL